MRAILKYAQKVISSGKDGTICIRVDTGEIGTLTIKNQSIVAATLGDSSGEEALATIKLAAIVHMEFWTDIILKSDIRRMIQVQAETNEMAPIPDNELFPEGASLSTDILSGESSSSELSGADASSVSNTKSTDLQA